MALPRHYVLLTLGGEAQLQTYRFLVSVHRDLDAAGGCVESGLVLLYQTVGYVLELSTSLTFGLALLVQI